MMGEDGEEQFAGAELGAPEVDAIRLLVPRVVDEARLHGVVGAHLRPLSAEARHLLEVGSVLGPRFAVSDAAALLGLPLSDVGPPVAEAIAARVLEEEGASLLFRQELVRHVISDRLPESVRRALHRPKSPPERDKHRSRSMVEFQEVKKMSVSVIPVLLSRVWLGTLFRF